MSKPFLFVAVLLVCSTSVHAQAPDPKSPSPEKHAIRESRGHKAAVRDGVKLSVDVYCPDIDGKHPVILIHTAYNNNSPGWTNRAKGFARRGYVVALSDCRSRFDSEGEWNPLGAKRKTDGYDLVEWLVKQPWCDGNVGMMGQSYMCWTQWWTATQSPPSLKAIVPEVAPPDPLFNGPYQNGILVCWMRDRAASQAGRTVQNAGAVNAGQLIEIEPKKVYEYTLSLWRGSGNVFQKGHRIRIEISSSFFPYDLPNPGTGEDNIGLQTRKVIAEQKTLHDVKHPSHVVLPIIPAR